MKEFSDIVVYNGLRVLGPLQTERKLSCCSRMVCGEHTLPNPGHGKLLWQGWPSGPELSLSCWRHIPGTPTPLLAHRV